jgi:imidazole glycerol-phosphate synthase subunit HisH
MRDGPPLIGVVDYGMGNRRSVQKALEHVGTTVLMTSDTEQLVEADGLVVPGVGAFPMAMHKLRELGLVEFTRERAAHGTPLLGICLGMQLLFEGSEELGNTDGLGLIPGIVTALQAGAQHIPHIGWSEVRFGPSSPLTTGLPERGCPFYHVHSFAARPARPAAVVASSEYGERFATIVSQGAVFGVQFHPEKSSTHGLQLLGNFVQLCAAQSAGARSAAAQA